MSSNYCLFPFLIDSDQKPGKLTNMAVDPSDSYNIKGPVEGNG